jgi:hypothetical protein
MQYCFYQLQNHEKPARPRQEMEPAVGFEPTTDGLQNRCSTTELSWRKLLLDSCL